MISLKYDGAPAIVNGKDFVATKSYFNRTPKIFKSVREINREFDGDLAVKMRTAFEHLPRTKITVQGDILFTNDDLRLDVFENKKYITFRNNTITYGYRFGTPEANELLTSKIGIAWHTSYDKDGVYAINDNKVSSIFPNDYRHTIFSTKVNSHTQYILLNNVISKGHCVTKEKWDEVERHSYLIQRFSNSLVRRKIDPETPQEYVSHLQDFILQYFKKEADKRKSASGKENQWNKCSEFLKIIDIFLLDFFSLYIALKTLKQEILQNTTPEDSSLKTFYKNENGTLVPCSHEGLVMSTDFLQVKLVNRMEFSNKNFNSEYE